MDICLRDRQTVCVKHGDADCPPSRIGFHPFWDNIRYKDKRVLYNAERPADRNPHLFIVGGKCVGGIAAYRPIKRIVNIDYRCFDGVCDVVDCGCCVWRDGSGRNSADSSHIFVRQVVRNFHVFVRKGSGARFCLRFPDNVKGKVDNLV